jgi:hypothetical protein
MENSEIVKKLFECFGSGDIPGAMNLFAEEVEFQSPVTGSAHKYITWSDKRTSKSEIGAFFMEMNEKVQPEKMVIKKIISEGKRVVVEGRNAGSARSTGKRYEHDWVMLFDLEKGKIVRNLHFYDPADVERAFE